jgi:hypothetical protein
VLEGRLVDAGLRAECGERDFGFTHRTRLHLAISDTAVEAAARAP